MTRGGGRAGGSKGLGPSGFGTFNPQGRDEVKLYVGNHSFETTEESMRGMFKVQAVWAGDRLLFAPRIGIVDG